MLLTKTAIDEAKKWSGCIETSNNKSTCINDIKALYGVKPNTDAYCAMFVWVCVNAACDRLNIENPLTKTASTLQMLSSSKQKLPVDTTPKKGAIFFFPTSIGGHVGFVTSVDGSNFGTIEANTSSPIKGEPEGVYEKTRNTKEQKFQFIHLETLDTIENNVNSFLLPLGAEIGSFRFNAAVATVLVTIGTVLAYKKLQK